MARANRHYFPGCVWHITHRCHQREFLLKHSRDRQRWIYWLHEAKKRFGLCILNYTVTPNHVHLLVLDTDKGVIPKSVQLVAGRTAQEYNKRKGRKGAFWEDRYHAVAVEKGKHLYQCLKYIDLNLVRAGVIDHPAEWPHCGYHEITNPRQRYSLIDHSALMETCGTKSKAQFIEEYKSWHQTQGDNSSRDEKWSGSIAVGSKTFIEGLKEQLRLKLRGRKVVKKDGSFTLSEHQEPYRTDFDHKMALLSLKNAHIWNYYDENSMG